MEKVKKMLRINKHNKFNFDIDYETKVISVHAQVQIQLIIAAVLAVSLLSILVAVF